MKNFSQIEIVTLAGFVAFIIYSISKGSTNNSGTQAGQNSGNILGGNNFFSNNSLGFGGASGSWTDNSTPGLTIGPDGTAYDELGMPI